METAELLNIKENFIQIKQKIIELEHLLQQKDKISTDVSIFTTTINHNHTWGTWGVFTYEYLANT